jgi:hypothetical protein
VSRIVRLYPAAWRERYEPEFAELLTTRPPGLLDRLDIVRGALDAHLHPQVLDRREIQSPSPASEDNVRLARRLGVGAVGGAALWIIAWMVAALGPVRYDADGAYRDGAAAAPFLLGAVGLLAGGLGGQLVRLPRSARLARIGAGVALPFLLIWGLQPWLLWAAIPMVGGLVVLAIGAHQSGAWPTWPSVSVALACLVVVAIMAYGLSSAVDRMAGGTLFSVAATAFVPVWLGVGATLIQRPSPG